MEPEFDFERQRASELLGEQKANAVAEKRRKEERMSASQKVLARRAEGRLGRVGTKYRAGLIAQNRFACEACGYTCADLTADILQVHHVVPLSCGGGHEHSNLLLLCPNCHAISHKLWRIFRISAVERGWMGPSDKTVMADGIRLVTSSATTSSPNTRGHRA